MPLPLEKTTTENQKTYAVSGPKGLPVLGMMLAANRDQLGFLRHNAVNYGEIIPFHIMGLNVIQVNHPELVKYVLMENHKNYHKSKAYIRFESVLGKGLLTSNGEKWRRDRQRIQPMFKREQMEGYYFEVINDVADKYKKRWLALTEKGPAELNITQEMSAITLEVIVKLIFGKDNLDEQTIASLHHTTDVFMEYLKHIRLFPNVDLEQILRTPRFMRFQKELDNLNGIINSLLEQYKKGLLSDNFNMLALLLAAQKADPEHFSEQDIRDQCSTMLFAGFETTAILMQWMWYVLDSHQDVSDKLRSHIIDRAPSVATFNSSPVAFDAIHAMDYLDAVFKETMRLYPSFWVTSREPVVDDYLGDYKVKKGTLIVLPQIIIQRHPRWWDEPDAFIPERFLGDNETKINEGLYFPFSQGARKCIGYRLAELETKVVFAKLLPLFNVKILNATNNGFDPAISLRPQYTLKAQISRL